MRGLNQNDPKVLAAYNACKSLIPSSFVQGAQQGQQALSSFISCMADHGVTITTGAAGSGTPPTTFDQTSSAFQTCKTLLPAGAAGGNASPPTTAL